MDPSRRHFLRRSAAFSAGFAGLHAFMATRPSAAAPAGEPPALDHRAGCGYGPLLADPHKTLDLPAGFSYTVVSRRGQVMADGLLVPGQPDGMACFAGESAGIVLVVCNHELEADWKKYGPFGAGNEHFGKFDRRKLFDDGGGTHPSLGGTTTIVYDTKKQRTLRQFVSLAGTNRNCAGGPTPWNSWLTCEEDEVRAGDDTGATQDHGWVFEVPAIGTGPAEPLPIRAMGRFMHEAVCVDPRTGIAYLTEDKTDGLLYRYIPEQRERLHAGGKLQALVLRDALSAHTGNHEKPPDGAAARAIARGEKLAVRWMDMEEVHAPKNDLRMRGLAAGAATFARNEGMWWAKGADATPGYAYFAATIGGRAGRGQLWRYRPSDAEGLAAEADNPGELELFIEPNDASVIENPDNITVAPWGDLIVCEDGGDADPGNRLLGVTPGGDVYVLAKNVVSSTEFAGACFSPDGSTLFVNLQGDGLTLAITGPWRGGRG